MFLFFFFSLHQDCVALEELYLSHNGISKMEGLGTLVNLRVLDVSSNKLTSVDDIQNLAKYLFSLLLAVHSRVVTSIADFNS